jgi:DUF1680 family protein
MMEGALRGSISGLSLDGSLFFYENPLESRGATTAGNGIAARAAAQCRAHGASSAAISMAFRTTRTVHLYGDSAARFEIRVGSWACSDQQLS